MKSSENGEAANQGDPIILLRAARQLHQERKHSLWHVLRDPIERLQLFFFVPRISCINVSIPLHVLRDP